MSLSGLKDVDREILKHIDDKDLLKICSLNRKTWNEICDDNFLKRRLWSKYPGIEKYKKRNESWKFFFLRSLYYISKMKEKYKFEYIEGDFRKQYELLSRYKGDDLLFESIAQGQLSLVKHAVKLGVDIDQYKNHSLRWAARNGHFEVVRYLIEHGINIDIVMDEALVWARKNKHHQIVKYLIEHGANPHAH